VARNLQNPLGENAFFSSGKAHDDAGAFDAGAECRAQCR